MLSGALLLAAASLSHGPIPVMEEGAWIRVEDWPIREAMFGQGGALWIDIHVDREGQPVNCEVTHNSINKRLDRAACDAVMRRGKFLPATDREGKYVASVFKTAVRFSISGRGKGNPLAEGAELRRAIDAERYPERIGVVAVRRMVDAQGNVEWCEVEASSGSEELDSIACTEAERVEPRLVLDGDDKPVRGLRTVTMEFLPRAKRTSS